MSVVESTSVPALLRRHWLVLTLVLLYLLRWVQYVVEAAAYRAGPPPGGAGDALGWLLLGQFYLAIALVVVLLACAGWRRAHWRFYLMLAGVVALPFGLLAVLEN
ncbi:hypothetical protein Q5H93_06645 [Hymenobacter sp. ASUV-10]|uniref:Uncharacterized protein n=1 Tax=Hymenobacter aranciens TaxID=3063996 RepID=A0ABT9B9C5_9BACT|nr:hypothetical protein [Hymenobacter sp. ASUV-10]MDO7874405.1 hypothetical protein [Hymenobacter sp. ASUV-10]